MHVRKRDGSLEAIDLNKIVRAVSRSAEGIPYVDPNRVAVRTIGGLYNGASTKELDELSIQTASSLIAEEPNYSKLAASLLAEYIRKEVAHQDIQSFSQSIHVGFEQGLINHRLLEFVKTHSRKLNNAVD
jgi:ribonucleoside-diphosphate reductase alpha chain